MGYRLYARHLAQHVFRLSPDRVTPAHTLSDGVDYVPTQRSVLFGHHYAYITGLAPMLGPAVAVIWGWLPAMLWVVFGAILVGCVHDFSSLVVSMRAQGQSIGTVAESVIGRRAKYFFLALIFFGVALAMGVFVYVISVLFQAGADFDPSNIALAKTSFPSAVLPSGSLMVMAMVMGFLLYKKQFPILPLTIVGFVLMLATVWLGTKYPLVGLSRQRWPSQTMWTWILLAYAYLASVLPVWSLLQARDFLNSLLLYLGLGLTYAGFFLLGPTFAAPAINPHPVGAPPLFPFVFIVIACGAASGFHSLVASGTTAKQINKETDARFIAYGGMIGESLLGLLAVLACTAGFDSITSWNTAYADWATVSGLAAKLGAFIHGCTRFIGALGIEHDLAAGFISAVVVSFALTTLDSATRLLRFNVSEIGESLCVRVLQNRFVATGLAVGAICWFAFYKIDGKPAGLALWTLFGTINQMLAGLALLVATLYLRQRRRHAWFTGVPMAFMLVSTFTALVTNLKSFYDKGQTLLLIVGTLLLIVGVSIVISGIAAFARNKHYEDDVITFSEAKRPATYQKDLSL